MHIFNSHLPPTFAWTRDQLLAYRAAHPYSVVRLDPRGRVIILPSKVGFLNINTDILNLMLWDWHFQTGDSGMIADQRLPIRLRNGRFCYPVASWTQADRTKAHLAPDFVIVLRKADEPIKELHKQMVALMEGGCRLSWLIDPYNQTACVYRADGTGEMIEDFLTSLSGEAILPALEIPLFLLKVGDADLIRFAETQSN